MDGVDGDPLEIAGFVTREVRRGERDGRATRTSVLTRVFATDPADLWDAVTNVERLPRWFLPITGTLAEGGRYQLEGNAGGTIERCRPPEHLAVTWEYAGSMSWLTVTLTPVETGTELRLEHESPTDPGFWQEYGPGATGLGWDLAFVGLAEHLAGVPVEPDWETRFAGSPAGAAFLAAAGTGWADAAIDDGDVAQVARDAAQRSVAFFTPEPEHP